ncbi:MAG: hypothetical protein ABTR07_15305 [Candidatus Competibacter denitrificans]
MNVAALPTAKSSAGCVTRIDTNTLLHDCYEQLDALATLAGMSGGEPSLSGDHWMMLLNPLVERMRLLVYLHDHHHDEAEFRVVPLLQSRSLTD